MAVVGISLLFSGSFIILPFTCRFTVHLKLVFVCGMKSVQFCCSVMSDSLRPHELQHARPPCITNSRSSLTRMSIESVMPSSHLILWCSLLLPPIPPSIRVFSNESTLRIRWPEYWRFSFSISPSNEHPGLISFRMDWLDLLVVQGTLKSLLQHHSSKTSVLWRSAFFTVQLSHPYMTTGKTIALIFSQWVIICLNAVYWKDCPLAQWHLCHSVTMFQYPYSLFSWQPPCLNYSL